MNERSTTEGAGDDPFTSEVARHIWDSKYRYYPPQGGAPEPSIQHTWRRVARAIAAVEPRDPEEWSTRFEALLAGFRLLPGGRIQAGAGTAHRVTLFNCFVMGLIDDSMTGIFDALKQGAETMQQGGGVGYDFSTLRPRGSRARTTGTIASGPVSFMQIWDAMCSTILSTGARRGAMMATLRIDHPDVEEFVQAKRTAGVLRNFNVSVQVTDAFMEAVSRDEAWPLVFPAERLSVPNGAARVSREWPGHDGQVECAVLREVSARELWARIMRATYESSEPGVLFVDRVNRANNLWYRERITATNPCGELPLPPYGACDLGALNLTRFVRRSFMEQAEIDFDSLRSATALAVRLLDDVIDASRFPLPEQEQQARASRRIGLGVTGLADALVMLGLHYAEPQARRLAAEIQRTICHAAYQASIKLAREKGPFPYYRRDEYLAGEFLRSLPAELREAIARDGIRNSHLLAIAPTGTISMLANNVSSGIEPIFASSYRRRILERDGSSTEHELVDYAVQVWRSKARAPGLPPAFTTVAEVSPEAQIEMQAALQPFVDSAISKTVTVGREYDFEAFAGLYRLAYELGLKGCTTFRPSAVRGEVLTALEVEEAERSRCCTLEREAD